MSFSGPLLSGSFISGSEFYGTALEKFEPSLFLDFATSKSLDSRITFTRASSATYYDAQGTLQTAASGVPRFDHDPVTVESLGLLIEEQRTNQLLRSQEFDDAYWVKADATITANTIVAPDGTLTGDALVSSINGGSNTCFVSKPTGVAASTNYTYSVFIKKGTSPTTMLTFYRASPYSPVFGTINWSTETMSVSGAILLASSFIPVGNGWYRASLTINSDTATSLVCRLYVRDDGTANVAGEYVYIWGAQLEAGSFPTSYIKTEGSQVTRSADAASMTGTNFSSWYRQDEGTLYAAGKTVDSIAGFVGADNGTTQNRIRIYQNTASTIRSDLFYNGATVLTGGGGSPLLGQLNKTATAYETGALASSTNGATVTSVAATLVPFVTQLRIGNVDGISYLNGSVSKIAFYPKRLTNAQLQALTR